MTLIKNCNCVNGVAGGERGEECHVPGSWVSVAMALSKNLSVSVWLLLIAILPVLLSCCEFDIGHRAHGRATGQCGAKQLCCHAQPGIAMGVWEGEWFWR